MTNKRLFPATDRSAALAVLRQHQHVWSMLREGRQMDCELRYHGDYGVEVRVSDRGEFAFSRLFRAPELAIAEAYEQRERLERRGWTAA